MLTKEQIENTSLQSEQTGLRQTISDQAGRIMDLEGDKAELLAALQKLYDEQNDAEIADMKFRIEGDAILLQAANQTIEKERAKISELEKYRDNHLRTIAALQDEKAEMLAFLENVGSPKRKSDEEGWDIFEIARRARALVKKYRNE